MCWSTTYLKPVSGGNFSWDDRSLISPQKGLLNQASIDDGGVAFWGHPWASIMNHNAHILNHFWRKPMELMERLPKSLAQPRPAKLRQTLCEFGGSRGPITPPKCCLFLPHAFQEGWLGQFIGHWVILMRYQAGSSVKWEQRCDGHA